MGNTFRLKTFFIFLVILFVLTIFVFVSTEFLTAKAESVLSVSMQTNGGTVEGAEIKEDGTIDFEVGEEETILPVPTKTGYDFLGWTKTENQEDEEYITSLNRENAGEISKLYARFSLKNPEIITQPTDYGGIYGNTHILKVEVSHEGDFSLNVQWFKDGNVINGATDKAFEVKDVKDSGVYYAIVSVCVNGDVKETKSRNAVVRIQKARQTTAPEVILTGVYSPDKKLSDYNLPTNFKWLDDGVIPTPNVLKYTAIFNIDSDNYYDYHCSVMLIIKKAEQVIYAEDFTKEYDGISASISATSSGNTPIVYSDNNFLTNVGKETVAITALENDFYLSSSVVVVLEILPQKVQVEWTNLSFIYNENIQIPTAKAFDKSGFEIELSVDAKGKNAGEYVANAIALSENYELINPSVAYIIEKADFNSDLILIENKEVVFDGNKHTLEAKNIPEWLSVEYDLTPDKPGVYSITASFVLSNENYNPIGTKTATLTILQNRFVGEWYEIYCPEGVKPDTTLTLEMFDADGLFVNNNGKLKYILAFRVVSSDKTVYRKPMTIKFNYENVGLDNLVLSVDKDSNERILTYTYQNGIVEFKIDGAENNIVFAERTKSITWIIILVVGICIVVSLALYFILFKKSIEQDKQKNE